MEWEAFLVGGVRTPLGRYGGTLAAVRPDDLAATVLAEVVRRVGVAPAVLDEVVLGVAGQAGEDSRNVARTAALLAGFPNHVPGYTVNRLCAGGLTAVINAGRAVRTGDADLVAAGGVESTTRAPWVMAKPARAWDRPGAVADAMADDRFANPRLYAPGLGAAAEEVARRDGVTRHESDAYALDSHDRAVAAREKGWFDDELLAVPTPSGPIAADEGPSHDTDARALAHLRPIFAPDGIITAGSCAPAGDGAAALLVAGRDALERYDLRPRARIVAAAGAGVPPASAGLGPVPATERALRRAGWSAADLDAVELHEASAPQVLGCVRRLRVDPEIVNADGGSIAFGHPVGCTGVRLVLMLLGRLERENGRRGLATTCVDRGQGVSLLVERL